MKFNDVIPPGFSTSQTVRLTGLSTRQLDHWDRKGFIKPSLEAARGYGSRRRYSFADVVRLRVAARLRAAASGSRESTLRRGLERWADTADLGGVRCSSRARRSSGRGRTAKVVDLLRMPLVLVFSVGDASKRPRERLRA